MFNTLKLTAFSKLDLSTTEATMLTHGIMLVLIAVAPIGMDWVVNSPYATSSRKHRKHHKKKKKMVDSKKDN